MNISTEEIGTLCSRQIHFINVSTDYKIGKYVALKGFTLNIRNISMVCYTTNLAGGEMLLCKTIASRTVL